MATDGVKILIAEIERLIVVNDQVVKENEDLNKEIKQTRITKNIEIDEVEALYTKTKQELDVANKKIQELKTNIFDDFGQYNIINEINKIIEFKKQPEYKQFREDFIKYGINYDYSSDNKQPIKPYPIKQQPLCAKKNNLSVNIAYETYVNKYKHILKNFKILDIDIKSLIETYNRKSNFDRNTTDIVIDMYNFMFDIDIVKLYV
jgi:hypothetical protein